MPITRRTDYAVRLMYELAQLPHGVTISRRDLSAAADVPEAFGEPLIGFLVEAGLVAEIGYSSNLLALAVPADSVSMARIVCASEPSFSLSQCTRDPESCSRSAHCGVHSMWIDLDQIVWDYLRTTTLADVAARRAHPSERGITRRCEQLSESLDYS
jgi:Rrf2 family protein